MIVANCHFVCIHIHTTGKMVSASTRYLDLLRASFWYYIYKIPLFNQCFWFSCCMCFCLLFSVFLSLFLLSVLSFCIIYLFVCRYACLTFPYLFVCGLCLKYCQYIQCQLNVELSFVSTWSDNYTEPFQQVDAVLMPTKINWVETKGEDLVYFADQSPTIKVLKLAV